MTKTVYFLIVYLKTKFDLNFCHLIYFGFYQLCFLLLKKLVRTAPTLQGSIKTLLRTAQHKDI